MNKKFGWGLGACVAALALVLNAGVASAQQKAPDAPGKAPAAKAPAAKAPAAKAPAAPPAAKKAAPAKKAAAKSECAGLAEAACTGNAVCAWYKEVTISKGPQKGTKRAAHCQKKPTPPKKAPAAAKKAAPKAAAPAPAPAPAPAKK